jgi:serine/threonine-protein kinase
MVFTRPGEETKGDLFSILLEGDGEPVVFLQTEADENEPALSPDGRYVAYVSNESGQDQVYIKPFPEGAGKWQVSVDQSWGVSWSPVGDRVYFLSHLSLMEVEVSTDPALRLSTPRLLIDGEKTQLTLWRGFAVAADGTRFVGVREWEEDEGEEEVEDGIHVVENWFLDFGE